VIEVETWRAWGAVLEVGDAVSQLLSLAAVKLSVPAPLFVTFTVADDGLLPPTVAENGTTLGETDSTCIAKLTPLTTPPLMVTD
jgi:hypothetical protein